MVAPFIQEYSRKIVEKFSPKRVILFGSYARNEARSSSDVDMLVIMEHDQRNIRKAIEILHAIERDFPIDLLVRTPSEVRERLAGNDSFIHDILKKGVVLYDSGS